MAQGNGRPAPKIEFMLISQTQAIKQMKAETGLNETTCTALIKAMPKTRDGQREKVHVKNLADVIDWRNGIRDAAVVSVNVHLSRKVRMRIRSMARSRK